MRVLRSKTASGIGVWHSVDPECRVGGGGAYLSVVGTHIGCNIMVGPENCAVTTLLNMPVMSCSASVRCLALTKLLLLLATRERWALVKHSTTGSPKFMHNTVDEALSKGELRNSIDVDILSACILQYRCKSDQ